MGASGGSSPSLRPRACRSGSAYAIVSRRPTRGCARTLACGVQMAFVTLRDGESPEGIVSRFRAAVTRNGILKEHKDRRFFRSKGEKARLAARRSARRRRRAGG